MPSLFFQEVKAPRADSSAPCVVALHGMLGFREAMVPLCECLNANGVLVVDLPGHGKSPAMENYTVNKMAEALLSDLKELSAKIKTGFYLLGHSLGGQVALAAALQSSVFSVSVAGVCAIDICPFNYFLDKRGLPEVFPGYDIVALMKVLSAKATPPPGTWEEVVRSLTATSAEEQQQRPSLSAECLSSLKSVYSEAAEPGGVGRWQMDVCGLERSLSNSSLAWGVALSDEKGCSLKFKGPALVLRGGTSSWVDVEVHGDALQAFFPHCAVETIQGAGHAPHREKADQTLKAIQKALDALS